MLKVSNKNINKINSHPHSLNKWVNVFFIVFILGVVILTGAVYYYTDSYTLMNERSDIKEIVSVTQNGMIFLASLFISGIGLVWIYLHKFIISPLNQMKTAAEQIIHGQLDQSIDMKAPLEIKRLYESINDLSVNVQEVLLFVWNQTEASLRCLDGDWNEDKDSERASAGVDAVKHSMLELQKMVSTFSLYDVRLDNKKVIDGSEKD